MGGTLYVSLLTDREEVHDKCRECRAHWRRLQRGKRQFKNEEREKNNKPGILRHHHHLKNNESTLFETVQEAEKLGVDAWQFTIHVHNEPTRTGTHKNIWGKTGHNPFAWKGYVRDTSNLNVEKIAEQVKKIKAQKFRTPVLFVPNLKPEEIKTYYDEPENFFGYKNVFHPGSSWT